MGKTFVEKGLDTSEAVFNVFFRKAPDGNNWAVVCGIQEALDIIEGLGNKPASFFKPFLPEPAYDAFCTYMEGVRFTGDVFAMEEGQIAFPKQPILTVKAPLLQAQILETPILCILNHQMAIATKASRVTRSTTKPVSEFGSRRAHGPWAAQHGGKAAYIGGCLNTSNILATTEYGIPCSGTMGHSFVTAFGCGIGNEYTAFDAYINSHRGEPLIMLVDTYDTLKSGVRNAIKAFKDNGIDDKYKPLYGIRLDSGDLAYLSSQARLLLDEAGLKECKIFVTNSLDEYLIADLERQNAAIDFYGVGDAIATSKHNPCFGNVYKLVQMDGTPVLKCSDDKAKLINPGFQVTYRIYQRGENKADVTCLTNDTLAQAIEKGDSITLRDEDNPSLEKTYAAGTYTAEKLQRQMIAAGKRVVADIPAKEKRAFYLRNLSMLNPTERRLVNPHYHKVDISDDLYDLKMGILFRLKDELKHWQK